MAMSVQPLTVMAKEETFLEFYLRNSEASASEFKEEMLLLY